MFILKLSLFSFILLFNNPLFAVGAENLLRAEQAFKVSAKLLTPEQLELKWDISEDYYLYRDKIVVSSKTPGVEIGTLDLPVGKNKHDDNFGDMVIYRNTVSVKVPVKHTGNITTFKLQVQHQGCADVGVCYPPQKNLFDLNLPAAKPNAQLNPLQALTNGLPPASIQNDLLPAEQAFQFFASIKDAHTLHVNWIIAEGYYLYREKIQLTLKETQGVTLETVEIPHGKPQHDEAFGNVEIFYHELDFDLPLSRTSQAPLTLNLQASFQGCAERGVCYPPMQQTIPINLPAALNNVASTITPPATTPLSEQDQIIQALHKDSLMLTLLSFFGFGLLLAFTPCIFPMIPILSGIIVGKNREVTTLTAFLLSLSYVLASAVAYTVFGVLAALFGNNLQATFQQPWIIALFSAIFVLLALSMFGFYHLELPKAFQVRLHNSSEKFRNHSYWGAAIMGVLSSLIVGPCVAAPLAGALIFIGQTGDALLGGSALFMMGLGMGVPLLALGASAGKLLPKAGRWLNITKAVFGVLMLAVAVWMLERIVPASVSMLLWAMLLIIPAIYLRALDNLPESSSNWSRLWKGLGLIMLIYGVILLVGLSAGNTNPLKPLQNLNINKPAQTSTTLVFKRIRSNAELDRVIQQASANKQIVMLDFYADWCISCKEMDAYTFSDPNVQQRLNNMVLVQANVTDATDDDFALLKRFNLIGPPATLFFGLDQTEQAAYRVIGFKDAAQFLAGIKTL
ncbi:MAG: protein-disulfide reductase DsbD [Methylococcaceae bacterium]|nr:protein-disulfide reductase DsbD [Methylococcaceae bacterium]